MSDTEGLLFLAGMTLLARIVHGPFVAPPEDRPKKPSFRERARVVDPEPARPSRDIPADSADELGLLDDAEEEDP